LLQKVFLTEPKKEKTMKKIIAMTIAAACFGLTSQVAMADVDVDKIFSKKCKMCHSIEKKKTGPAFKDMSTDPAVLKAALTEGRKLMPNFSKKLSGEEIDAMVAFIQSKQSAAE
jgi:mono/diheme cytochrome c family protein